MHRCKQKQPKILQNRTAGCKFKSGRPVHYFLCLFNKHVKILQERLKKAVFQTLKIFRFVGEYL